MPDPRVAPAARAATPTLSAAAWRRVRRGLTGGLFLVATAAGVVVGLQGAAVSPVAPPTTVVAAEAVAPGPVAVVQPAPDALTPDILTPGIPTPDVAAPRAAGRRGNR